MEQVPAPDGNVSREEAIGKFISHRGDSGIPGIFSDFDHFRGAARYINYIDLALQACLICIDQCCIASGPTQSTRKAPYCQDFLSLTSRKRHGIQGKLIHASQAPVGEMPATMRKRRDRSVHAARSIREPLA